jgi:hypothetical protein
MQNLGELYAYACSYPALRVSELSSHQNGAWVVVNNRVPNALPPFNFSASSFDDEGQHALLTCPTFPGISPVVAAFVEGALLRMCAHAGAPPPPPPPPLRAVSAASPPPPPPSPATNPPLQASSCWRCGRPP